jgi:hypothetical protein
MKIEWNDRQGSRDRQAWALIVTAEGTVLPFTGEPIPGIVAVAGSDYHKDGKWSSTTYRLELAAGCRFVSGYNGWETGRFTEGLLSAVGRSEPIDRWADVANALGVTLAQAQAFLRAWRPKAAAVLDEVEAALEAVDDAAPETGAAPVAISFGSPTNRSIREGFWEWPVRVLDADGAEVGRLTPADGWGSPTVTGPVRVLASEHASGMHGGYWSLRVAVPEGCTLVHGPAPEAVPAEPPHVQAAREWAKAGAELLGRGRLVLMLRAALVESTGVARMAFNADVSEAIERSSAPEAWRERLPRLGGAKGVPTFCGAAQDVLEALEAHPASEQVPAVPAPTAPSSVPPSPPPPASLDDLRAKFGR